MMPLKYLPQPKQPVYSPGKEAVARLAPAQWRAVKVIVEP